MNLIARTGLVAAITVGAVAAVVAPASAAIGADHARAMSGTHAVLANPKTVKAADYNEARTTLIQAGSRTAASSHPVHGKADVPVSYGTKLLAEARDEFRQADKKLPPKDKKSDMSIDHYNAIHKAAKKMGIDQW
ncbi:hypothetical protein [Streptomyces abikoensis]|uniref:hypothetical protein n=1 Tax=Streptomyces abikoensis TaxID=97398 RepID=UPI0033D0BF0C